MSAITFDAVSGPMADVLPSEALFGKTVKYGLKADVDFTVKGDYETKTTRRGALFTNVLSTFGVYDTYMVRDRVDFTGFNKQYLTDYGTLDQQRVQEGLKTSGRYSTLEALELSPKFTNYVGENHVAVLFNMLRIFVYKHATDEAGLVKFKSDDVFYDDGHVKISYRQYFGSEFKGDGAWNIGNMPNMAKVNGAGWQTTSFAPSVESFTERELNILFTCCSEIVSDSNVKLLTPTPLLVQQFVLPQWSKHSYGLVGVTDFSAAELFATLSKYVFENRIQEQFDHAYMLVCSIMFGPLPRSVEANAWITPRYDLNLPKPGSVRGMIPESVNGVPAIGRPAKYDTWSYFTANMNRIYVHGIVACEMIYAGLFEIATATKMGPEAALQQLGITGYAEANPFRIIIEAISYRTGTKITDLWNTNAGPDYIKNMIGSDIKQQSIAVSIIDTNLSGYEVYTKLAGGATQAYVRAREMKPVLFPVLSMGINDNRFYLNAMQYNATLKYDAYTDSLSTNSTTVANKFMSIMRVGGWDVLGTQMTTGVKHKNWAANSNGQVLPVFRTNDTDLIMFKMSDVLKRRKNWLAMPDLTSDLSVSVSVTPLTYVAFIDGRESKKTMMNKFTVPKYNGDLTRTTITEFNIVTKPDRLMYNYGSFLFQPPSDTETINLPLGSEGMTMLQSQGEVTEEVGQSDVHSNQDVSQL